MTDYLTVADVLAMHADQIERYGGTHGIRDRGLLESALYRPQTGYYSDLIEEAAALWERLTQAVGADARDAVWQHPDLLPSAEDLDEPAGFIDRIVGGDTSGMDEAIDKAIADLQKDSDKGDDDPEN